MSILSKIFDSNERQISKLSKIVTEINGYNEDYKKLKNDDFVSKTKKWQEELQKLSIIESKEYLNKIMPEAYALVKEAVRRTLGFEVHDVQLMAATVLHQGKIAEQKTGEGKTLTAVFPLYLNSLTGRGCHLVTPNDYLSKIGCGWMGPIYHLLGVSVSAIVHEQQYLYEDGFVDQTALDSRLIHLKHIERQAAYQADITYGTNNEFGFDYLRDNMVWDEREMRQTNRKGEWGAHQYAIVDEVDFILIDEARTPLIISAPGEESTQKYYEIDRIVKKLELEKDFAIDEKTKNSSLTEEGIAKLEGWLHVDNLYEKDFATVHHIEQALKANNNYQKDKDYIIKDGEIIIVDEFTGRLMYGRRYSEGLHQAIEAKEGVEIKQESKTLATISFQNYFRMYEKLAGMTGTAVTEAEEFFKIYKLEVVVIPTHVPVIRKDNADLIYKTEAAKFLAVMEEIKKQHETGQPILIGTTSIKKNEYLSELLKQNGVKHALLNAKHHEKEALILAAAGEKNAVTVATNMAGRGVDIELGGRKPDFFQVNKDDPKSLEKFQSDMKEWQTHHDEVLKLGGLYVIGTERHEARRIDNQLRGRAGRQGDSGQSRFFVSLEDDLMRVFGGEQVKKMMNFLQIPDDMPIENRMVSNALQSAQTRVEGYNFDSRKQLVEYDDVMNKQREVIYRRRRQILDESAQKDGQIDSQLKEKILKMFDEEVVNIVSFNKAEAGFDTQKIVTEFGTLIPFNARSRETIAKELSTVGESEIVDRLQKLTHEAYSLREKEVTPQIMRGIERFVSLTTIDNFWQLHLTDMDNLREGIGLRGFGQRDPLIEYKQESFRLFEILNERINYEIINRLFKIEAVRQETPIEVTVTHQEPESAVETKKQEISPAHQADAARQNADPITVGDKVGRNDPCPCGSGKKYKKCGLLNTSEHQQLMSKI